MKLRIGRAISLFFLITAVASAATIGPPYILPETSSNGPAVVHGPNETLLISWTGTDNFQLNFERRIAGAWQPKVTSKETSKVAPALAFFNGRFYVAWTGVGNNKLNVMSSADGVTWGGKVTLNETSTNGPALATFNNRLHLVWTGVGNNKLNFMGSTDGINFGGKVTIKETSESGPAAAGGAKYFHIAWRGVGNDKLNVIRCAEGVCIDKVTLAETTHVRPALLFNQASQQLILGWQGVNNKQLNLMVSTDGGLTFGPKTTSKQTSIGGPALAAHEPANVIAWTGTNEKHNLNVSELAP